MPAKFSDTEISIIGNMMISKSNKAIASLLERQLEDVALLISELKTRSGLSSYQDKLDARHANRKGRQGGYKRKERSAAAKAPKKSKQETDMQRLVREQKEMKEAAKRQRLKLDEKSRVDRKKARGPKFQTKVVDYSKLHTLRIDKKTVIYIKPGQDEQKVKADFLKTYKRSFKDSPEKI